MFNKFKSTVLVVIAVLGALEGTGLAQDVVIDADTDPEWKRVAEEQQKAAQEKARKAAEERAKKKALEDWAAQRAVQKKAEEERRAAEEKSADAQISPMPPLMVPDFQLQQPKLDVQEQLRKTAPVKAEAAQAPEKEFVVPPPPEKEPVDPTIPLWNGQGYLVPYAQAGFAFGYSPKGVSKTQTAPTVTYAGASGKAKLNDHMIGEYRFNLYLGKDDQGKVEMRELFAGMRFPFWRKNATEMRVHPWVHFGKQEDIGEAGFLFQPGNVSDARTLLRNTFSRPGWSVIAGISFEKYAQIMGEFNTQYSFHAVAFNTQYTWSLRGWSLQSLGHFGYRKAKDELGQVYQADLGLKAKIGPKENSLDLALVGGCERQTDLVTADQVKEGIEGEKYNVCLGQAAVTYFNFTVLYTEGAYIPLEKERGGYRNIHVEWKGQIPEVKLAVIPFASFGYAQNVSLFRVPALAPKPGIDTAYPIFQIGVRMTIGIKDPGAFTF